MTRSVRTFSKPSRFLVNTHVHPDHTGGNENFGIGYPYVDINSRGSLAGLLDGLGATIGRSGPHTKIIPGHGAVVDRNALIVQRDMLLAVRDRVSALIGQIKRWKR